MNTEYTVCFYVTEIVPYVIATIILYVQPATGTVYDDTHYIKVSCHTVRRHCHGQRNAEIDDGRTDPGVRIERFICVTEFVTIPAIETFDRNVQSLFFVIDNQVGELFPFDIISGKGAAAGRAGGVCGEGNSVNCRNAGLDNVSQDWWDTGQFHVVRASPDPVFSG